MLERIKKQFAPIISLVLFWLFALLSDAPFRHANEYGYGAIISNIILLVAIVGSIIVVIACDGLFERDFLYIALFLGVLFVMLRPFPSSIDENYHFMRSFELSMGRVLPDSAGGYVPEGYHKYAIKDYWNVLNIYNEPLWFKPVTQIEFIPRVRSASYLFFQYIPGAIGIGIARMFKLPLIGIVLSGRLFYYLYYVGTCYLAIRRTDTLKSLVFLISLSGGIALLFGLMQPDLVLVSTSLLFISICFHYCFDNVNGDRIRKTDSLLLCISALIISSIKYCGYAPILLLCLFIHKRRYANRDRTIKAVFICFAGVLVVQVFALLKYRESLGSAPQGVSMIKQIQYICSHPISAGKVLGGDIIGTAFERVLRQRETSSTVIDALANAYALFPALGAILAKDRPTLKISIDQKPFRFAFVSIILACCMQFFICISMYVNWTVVGSGVISGVHPRYSLPFLILCLVPLSFLKIDNRIDNWERFLSISSVICLLNTLVSKF